MKVGRGRLSPGISRVSFHCRAMKPHEVGEAGNAPFLLGSSASASGEERDRQGDFSGPFA